MEISHLLTALGDTSRCRLHVVSQLEDVSDDRVAFALADTLANDKEDDDLRVEILSSLVARNDTPSGRVKFANAILFALRVSNSLLVRQHAANAAYLYLDIDGVIGCLESLAGDESEDVDVRHNAVAAIESRVSFAPCREALERLRDVPPFERIIKDSLDLS